VATLFIDILLLILMLLFFVPFKNLRSHPDAIGKTPPYCERTATVASLASRVYNANDEEILRNCRFEGYSFLVNVRLYCILVAIISVIGLGMLIPIYYQGSSKVDSDLNEVAVQHILDNERYLWAVFFCWVFFSLLFYGIAGYYLYKVHSIETLERQAIETQSVQITKLPKTKPADDVQKRIVDYFKKRFPGCVLSVYVVPDVTEIYILQNQLKVAKQNMASAESYVDLKNKRPVVRSLCGSEDAIEYYVKEIKDCNQQIELLKPSARDYCLGYAYVIFQNPVDASDFVHSGSHPEPKILDFTYWEVSKAPSPKDIIWENQKSKMVYNLGFRVFLEVGFFIVFLIILTPTSMYDMIDDTFTNIGLGHFFRTFLAAYLPSLIPMLLHTVILPEAITLVVDLERHQTKSGALSSRLFKFIAFSMFYIVLVPMLGLGATELLKQIWEDDTDTWTVIFAEKLMHAGHIFCLYMIHMTFLGFGFELLQIPKVIKVLWDRWRALTVEDALKAYDADELDQARQFSMNLTTLGIVLIFSVVYPLILVFGACYFLLRLISQKYNLLCFYYVENIGNNTIIPHMVVKGMIVYVFIFQLLNAGVMMVTVDRDFIKLGSALVLTAFICLAVFFSCFNRVLLSRIRQDPSSPILNPNPQAYKHPADWKGATELESDSEE